MAKEKTSDEGGKLAAVAKDTGVAAAEPPPQYVDIAPYDSIRVIGQTHKLRHSHHHLLIQSGPGQTLMLSQRINTSYVCFRVVESGIEFPASNVASAIPMASSLASKMRKTTGSRIERKAKPIPNRKPAVKKPQSIEPSEEEMYDDVEVE